MSIVSVNVPYNSNILMQNLSLLLRKYPFLNVQTTGSSVLGKPIYAIKLGRGSKQIFYSASIHANEWITTPILMKFVEDYCVSYVNRSNLYGYSIRNLFNSTSIYIMPMVNPDGVDLVTGNIAVSSSTYQKALHIANQFPNIAFPNGWKSNINGVNLKNYQPFYQTSCSYLTTRLCSFYLPFILSTIYMHYLTCNI